MHPRHSLLVGDRRNVVDHDQRLTVECLQRDDRVLQAQLMSAELANHAGDFDEVAGGQ